jgi:hypothetical protein
VRKPVINQVNMSHPGEPISRAISALTINIPDPIIEPATIAVESKRFRLFRNWKVEDIWFY